MSLDRPAFHSVSASRVPHYALHFSCLSSLPEYMTPESYTLCALVSLFYAFMFFTHHTAKLLKAGAIGQGTSLPLCLLTAITGTVCVILTAIY